MDFLRRDISLGDTETLITHPGSLIKARQKIEPQARLSAGVSMELARLSVGLEDTDDIIKDLRQALDTLR